ncbi:MAG: polysaccharide biosynthesis protein [Oscillospiraceae bacterium]|jgi:stage V sporulation protein B|nr:polysaccharide biosynthesis protein [Oscillospiraceae bacterium]
MRQNTRRGFLYGAAVLSAATVIVKIFGFVYKIPIQNLLGPAASGYFTAAYDIFSTVFVLSTAGLPVAVSKLVSESEALGRPNQSLRVLRTALWVFVILGAMGTLFLLFGAEFIARAGASENIGASVRAVAPAMLLVCVAGAYRGFHQGHGDMTPTAVSQTLEAGIKAAGGVALAYAAVSMGASDEIKAAAAIGGVTLGSLGSAAYMLLARRKARVKAPRVKKGADAQSSPVLKRLVGIAVPVTLSSVAISLANLIDSMTITARLRGGAGFTGASAEYYFGAYGYARTLANLAPAFILAMSVSIVPAVAAARARRERVTEERIIASGLRLTALLAAPAAAGLFFLPGPVLDLLYGKHSYAVEIAAPLLAVLGISTFFTCIVSVTNAMLQARGRTVTPVVTMLLGAGLKVILSMALVGKPEINIMGAPVGTLACYALIAALNMAALARGGAGRKFLGVFVRPVLAAAVMGMMTKGFYLLFGRVSAFAGGKAATVASVLFGAVSYVVLAVLLRAFTKEDLSFFPKSEKISEFLHIY